MTRNCPCHRNTRLHCAIPDFVLLSISCLLAGSSLIAQERTEQPSPANATTPNNSPNPLSLGLSKAEHFTVPRPFPNLTAPYRPVRIPQPDLTNSPRADELVHDGKLELTLQDAVELALQNSMDIVVQRYNVWFAETDILQAEAGGQPQGVSGATIRQSTASIPSISFDPAIASALSYDDRTTPVNNPFTSGTGTTSAAAASLATHSAQYNTGYSQGFSTGTTMNVSWNNSRASSTSASNFFNPYVQSALTVSFSQQLLNGFGRFANRRNILIAKNNRKLAEMVFAQQAITTVTNAINAYWELVYARESVRVQQQAVAVSEKLYNDNMKQLEIGTMAPLDVTRAESQLATDRQNLIVAQTTQFQNEQTLKNAISKNPLTNNLLNVEIIPRDQPTPAEQAEPPTFEEAIKEAFAKRFDILEQQFNVTNAGIDVRATTIALRPTATLTAQYSSQGLAGNSLSSGGVTSYQGFGDTQSQILHNHYPDYYVGLNVTIPIRNREAQATNQRAILLQRQSEAQLQQLKNAALLDVRNTYIALQQDRARVQAASKARELQQQTFNAEQKKYQLGASTVYNVILTQRDFVSAQASELRAMADLVEAKASYDRAVGRTLEVNHVTVADSKHGEIIRDKLIPGTLYGHVIGSDGRLSTTQR
jgi:outer membrane protein